MSNELKLYYAVNNGEGERLIGGIEVCMQFIQEDMAAGEYLHTTPKDELPTYTVTPVWMTEEEFDNLPEADI